LKTRLPCSDGFSAAVRMSSPSVGRIARRGGAATHLPVRMNGSVGFAKSRKSNVRHVQIRHSWPSMTCQWNVIYAGPTRMAPRSLWASIRCLRIILVRSWLRISTKGNGEEMSSLLGRPASVTKFLLPLSALDPERLRRRQSLRLRILSVVCACEFSRCCPAAPSVPVGRIRGLQN
jgi:hypothetical protein